MTTQIETKVDHAQALLGADLELLKPIINAQTGYPEIAGVILQELLGEGAMGRVFKGFHKRLQIAVAVKIWKASTSADHERFMNEARVAARFNHPNIVRIYDVNVESGIVFAVQELVDGQSASELLIQSDASGVPISEARALEICADTARALCAIHRASFVHRDIKPANLLIQKADGTVKVADLGLILLLSHQQTDNANEIAGTFGYISPEQLLGFDASAQSDIYALGSTLYELVTGRHTFGGPSEHMYTIINRQVTGKVPNASEFRSDLSSATQQIIERCMLKDKHLRYQTAEEVLEDLVKARVHSSTTSIYQSNPAMPVKRSGEGDCPVVVFADDNESVRKLLKEALLAKGYSPQDFTCGNDVVAYLQTNDAELVVLDHEMPGLTGAETCTAIRAMPAHKNVPIVILSGLSATEVIAAAQTAGATDFLNKPIRSTEFIARVSCLIQLYRITRAREAIYSDYQTIGSRFPENKVL